jgi:hypothetical protein
MHILIEETDWYLIDLYAANTSEFYRNGWEQTRFISYVQAQTQSTKQLKITDIMNLPWDSDKQAKTVVDKGAKQRLAENIRNMEKQLNLS